MKALRHAFLPTLTALFGLTACQNELPPSSSDVDEVINEYTVNWVKTFGLIDPEQDWNMATRVTADIDPAAFGAGYVVHVYNTDPREGGVLIARVSSAETLGLDVAEDAESVYVRAYTPDYSAYMGAEYSITGGRVEIRAKSRADMPLSRASNLTEPDGYQWILACEDLGATDDYDFNDIVIGVNYVAETATTGTLTVTPLAAGGVYKAYVKYGTTELFEIHEPLNGEGPEVATGSHSMYNTRDWHNPAPSASVSLTVTEGFTIVENMGNITIEVVTPETTQTGTIITAPDPGTAPQIICVKGDWEWPMERVRIQSAYPGFTTWSSSSKTSDWNATKNAGNVIKRINGSVIVAGEELGHEYVDLGLPSGTLWATCNIGANYPEDYGNYYAYGETETKDTYTNENSLTYNRTLEELTDAGIIDANNNLTADYDAANVNWGGAWRMPTKTEMQELIDNCTWTWTTQDDINGYKVTSNTNGKYIFVPAAGELINSPHDIGNSGCYFTATVDNNTNLAWRWDFNNSHNFIYSGVRHYGRPIRPVIGTATPTPAPVHRYVDLGLTVKWATTNVGALFADSYGDYYAWGETETKSEYTEDNSLTYNKTVAELQTAGIIDASNNLTSAYDAAVANWGGTWRMPTKEEIDELLNEANCTWTWTTQHGVNGYKVTSKVEGYVGNYIFLSATGERYGTDLLDAGSNGRRWSATAFDDNALAYRLYFESSTRDSGAGNRYYGRPIRPVQP